MKKARKIGQVSQATLEDEWQRRATAAAIEAARGVVKDGGPIPPGAPIGRLSDSEWGWIVCAVLFGWIQTRAQQAVAENIDTEQTVRMIGLDPEPWDLGAVTAILPELADCCEIDWSKPLSAWSRETMAEFLLTAVRLVRKSIIARDLSERGVTRGANAGVIARLANAAAGGPLMTPDEFDDPIPF
jgi:hypothetical protein